MSACARCGASVGPLGEALTKKLVNRGCERFYCLHCLAAQFGVSEELLREKARQFQSSGCALFEGMEIGDTGT